MTERDEAPPETQEANFRIIAKLGDVLLSEQEHQASGSALGKLLKVIGAEGPKENDGAHKIADAIQAMSEEDLLQASYACEQLTGLLAGVNRLVQIDGARRTFKRLLSSKEN